MTTASSRYRMRLAAQTGPAASLRRMRAMVLRHWYLIRASLPRTLELIFWPLVSMLTWGFLQTHLARTNSVATGAAGLLVAGILLWDILARSQLGFATAFLEEVWSRNLGHLVMSPLRTGELIGSLLVVSVMKTAIAMVPVSVLAYLFFGFNLLSLGVAFGLFFANLTATGWALSLISTGAVLRWGQGAESIAWLIVFVMLPVSCVYYPVATLPVWLQPVALALPPTHVFEGLRALVLQGAFRSDEMLAAALLNVLYVAGCYLAFSRLLDSARRNGTLVQLGE